MTSLRKKGTRTALVGLLATGALLASTPVAHAEPGAEMSPQQAQDITGVVLENPTAEVLAARQQLATLLLETARITDEYNAAAEDKGEAEQAAAHANVRQNVAEAEAAKLQGEVGQIARNVYMGGGSLSDLAIVLDSEGPDEMTHRMGVMDKVAESRAAVLTDLEETRRNATAAELEAQVALQEAVAAEATMAEKAETVTEQTSEATERLQDLETDQARRERLAREAEAARAAQAARSTQATQAPQATQATGGSSGRAQTTGTAPAANTAAAQRALDFAYSKLGTPYVWGGTGNPGFDCSGLTSRAWGSAGVSIPRTSREQYAAFPKVSRDQLQPGDLVYFGSPVSHVGMYIGNGMMIGSPNSTSVVRIEKMWGNYVGANRPS